MSGPGRILLRIAVAAGGLFLLSPWAEGPSVFLLTSLDTGPIRELSSAIEAKLAGQVIGKICLLEDPERVEEALKRVRAASPKVLVTVGRFAAREVCRRKGWSCEVIHTGLLEPLDDPGGASQGWVVVRQSAVAQIVLLRKAYPGIKRVGYFTLRDPRSGELAEAEKGAQAMGISLSPRVIRDSGDLPAAYEDIRGKVDALWVPLEKALFNPNVVRFLVQQSNRDRLITFGESDAMVDMGILCAPLVLWEDVAEGVAVRVRGEEPPGGGEKPGVTYISAKRLKVNSATLQVLGAGCKPSGEVATVMK